MTRIADFLLERRKRRQLPFDRYLAKNGTAHIIVAGLTHTGFNGFGKVESKIFFPEFCKRLAEYGVSTYFCSTEAEIKKFQKGCICIINVINEVKKILEKIIQIYINLESEFSTIGKWLISSRIK